MAKAAGPGASGPRLAAAAAALLLLAASPAVAAAKVEVTVSGVRDGRGVVRVALCIQAEFLAVHCAHNVAAPAQKGVVVVAFADVPPGTYAAQAWHDQDNNGRLDRNALGVPREGVGFSNNPALLLGPPAFREASFTVGEVGGRPHCACATFGSDAPRGGSRRRGARVRHSRQLPVHRRFRVFVARRRFW